MALRDRAIKAWNAFRGREPTPSSERTYSSYRPTRPMFSTNSYRTKLASVQNRIAIDAASYDIVHCKVDKENGKYLSKIHSGLQECLELDANIDQTGRTFRHDVFASCLDEGCVAIVPTDIDDEPTDDPDNVSLYKVEKLRTGRVVQWYTDKVIVNVYDETSGQRKDVEMPKFMIGIVENPFAAVMNNPNSTLARLKKVLSQMDTVNDLASSGKLDMIIQLPYALKNEAKQKQAAKRREDIQMQLKDSTYGIAYIDSTEKITQLSRPLENNLIKQAEALEKSLLDELYITPEILNGTATPEVMTNYFSRIIEPLVSNVCDEIKRKFLTKTARTQGQSILSFRDPFKLVPVNQIPDLADKLTRNEICSSNEMRSAIGLKPSTDPKADELRNKNLNETAGQQNAMAGEESEEGPTDEFGIQYTPEYAQSQGMDQQ